MARFDRCSVCDYTEEEGSSLAGINPFVNGKVKRVGDDVLCDRCAFEVEQARMALCPPEEELEPEDLEE